MAGKYFKKLFLCIILLTFCVYPIMTIAAEEDQTTPINAADLVGSFLLLNPATWPVGSVLLTTSKAMSGGTDLCTASGAVSNLSPYCAILNVIFDIEKVAAVSIVNFGQSILSKTTDSSILTQSSDQNNVIIQSGWQIVRNIANAALVIGLIIIAITIILGYQENKAKQVLINFILIALLINFTPVICSFIIDGANVITASFLAGGTDTGYPGAIKNAFTILINDTSITLLTRVVYGMIIVAFSLVAAIIMFLYTLLFMARVAILWLLVIISPVAFATKVFPQSKYIKKVFPSVTYWDDWWESFIQWAVIGIPAAISLYISIQLMSVVGASVATMTTSTIPDFLMAYALPFIFLIAGFMITISSGGQVGSFVGGTIAGGIAAATVGRAMTWGKEKAKAGGEWVTGGAERMATGAAVGLGAGLKEGYQNDAGLKGAIIGGATGAAMGALTPEGRERAAKKIAEVKEGIGWAKRGEYASKLSGDVEEAKKRMANLSEDEQRKILYSGAETRQGGIDRIGALKQLTEKGKLKTEDLNFLVQNKKMVESLGGDLKEVSKARPDYAPQLVNKTPSEIVSGMSPSEAGKKINSGAFASPSVLFSTHYNVINGKIKKGSAEDIKNIKSGLITELNNYLSSIPGANLQTITESNIGDQIQNNFDVIENYLETLRNDATEASKRKEQTLSELLNHVYDGNI